MAATSAAVALSWFGVHSVMSGTAYDPPQALPLSEGDTVAPSGSRGPAAPTPAESTRRPKPPATESKTPTRRTQSPKPPGPAPDGGGYPAASKPPYTATTKPPGGSYGNVKTYSVDGGRAVFDIQQDEASLVQATPNSGWGVETWSNTTWIRVDFSRAGSTWTIFCDWTNGPPTVQSWKNGT